MKKLMLLSAALICTGGFAMASVTAEELVASYQAQGYTTIEVKTGPTQIKVEAVQGRAQVEVVYDAASGSILKQQTNRARNRDAGQGVELQVVDRDFVGVNNGGGNGNGNGGGHGGGDDDGPGHDVGDDHGHDGAGHDAGDDHGGNSGRGGGNSGHGGSGSHD